MMTSEDLEEILRSERAKGVQRLRELGVSEGEIARLMPRIEQMHEEQVAWATQQGRNLSLLLDMTVDTVH
jgi:hypothetical protein